MNAANLRIGILAGEASGDILGSRLICALKKHYGESITFEGLGGPLMEAQGLNSMFPMERLSVMGLLEPLKRLPELLRIRGALYRHFRDNPPDLFIGIDSPDFTLHLEQKLRRCGIKTAHLVSPSVWAWRRGRIRKIKRAVDLMLCLFPFETQIYQDNNVPVAFVGHPLADEIPRRTDSLAARTMLGLGAADKVVALLPGSRGGEVRLLAPLFLRAATILASSEPELVFIMPAANKARYEELCVVAREFSDINVQIIQGQSRDALAAADSVLLASGTATLEALLLKRPMVVAYRMAAFSWFLISRMLTARFVALPNLLANQLLVPELLQGQATPEALAGAVRAQLASKEERQKLVTEFDHIHNSLALDFSDKAALALGELLARKKP